MFFPLPKEETFKRKGHTLHAPTDEQKFEIRDALLRKIRIEEWKIDDVTEFFSYDEGTNDKWNTRSESLIDTIVIGATDAARWDSKEMEIYDKSLNNDVVKERLPGISYHLFINTNAVVEKTSNYNNVTWHSPGVNSRSLGVVLQYTINGNKNAPPKRMLLALERLLVVLCMEYKLNPYKAIKSQSEIYRQLKTKLLLWLPWIKWHRKTGKISPGSLVPLNAIKEQVVIKMKTKLQYADLYDGQIDAKFNRATRKALNSFHSDSIKLLYSTNLLSKFKDFYARNGAQSK